MASAPFLLDTSIVVHLIRWKDLGQRIDAEYGLTKARETPFVSVVSLGEARSLAAQWKWGPGKVERLHRLFHELVVVGIESEPVLAAYAEIDVHSHAVGRRMGKNDVWIAATAVATSATLLTCDQDFDHLQGSLLDRVLISATS